MEQGLLECLAAIVRQSDERTAYLKQHLPRQDKILKELLQKSALNFEVATIQQQVAIGATMQSPRQAVSA